jgi:hypothetical protein
MIFNKPRREYSKPISCLAVSVTALRRDRHVWTIYFRSCGNTNTTEPKRRGAHIINMPDATE